MIRRFKRAWIKALRSGRYKQTAGRLCGINPSTGKISGYCCLGVLCEVAKKEGLPITSKKIDRIKHYRFNNDKQTLTGGLGPKLRSRLKISNKKETHLITMNDSAGKSFSEIADYIEENL